MRRPALPFGGEAVSAGILCGGGAQQVHGGVQLRHPLMIADAAIGMMDRRQRSESLSQHFPAWNPARRKPQNMQCLGPCLDTVRQRFEYQCGDHRLEATHLAIQCLPVCGVVETQLRRPAIHRQRHTERPSYRNRIKPFGEPNLQPGFSLPGLARRRARLQDNRFAVVGCRISRIWKGLDLMHRHQQHDRSRQVPCIDLTSRGERGDIVAKARRTRNGVRSFFHTTNPSRFVVPTNGMRTVPACRGNDSQPVPTGETISTR